MTFWNDRGYPSNKLHGTPGISATALPSRPRWPRCGCSSPDGRRHRSCLQPGLPHITPHSTSGGSNAPVAWANWFARTELPAANAFQGSIFENFAMISKAAMAGLGVALLPTYFIEEELKMGSLVALAPVQRSRNAAYYIVIPETKVGTPHVQAFVKWVEKAKHDRLPKTRRSK